MLNTAALSEKLIDIHCSCGKKIGRGIGVFELPCKNKGKHGGCKVIVLGEATRQRTIIYSVTEIMPEGITPEMGLP